MRTRPPMLRSVSRIALGAAMLIAITILMLPLSSSMSGQQVSQNARMSTVPTIIQFSGVISSSSLTSEPETLSITFTLYETQQGGTGLWSETQNVQVDSQGHYSVLLGSTSPEGLPLSLFTSGQAHWLAVQPLTPAATEEPRVLIVGVPYAMKAADADTLGGLPASAFVTVPAAVGNGTVPTEPSSTPSGSSPTSTGGSVSGQSTAPPATVMGNGMPDFIPVWKTPTTLGNSLIYQTGPGGSIGIGTKTPTSLLDVDGTATIEGILTLPSLGTATASMGFDSQPLDLLASSFDSSHNTSVSQHFRWQSEAVGQDTPNPTGSMNLLYASGTGTPAETGISFGPAGGVTGNQIISTAATGSAPLMVNSSTQVANLNVSLLGGMPASSFQPAGSYATLGANTFAGNQTVNANISASGSVSGNQLASTAATGTPPLAVNSVTQVANLNASLLGGMPASSFQPAGSYATLGANTFSATQTISSGNLALPQTSASSVGVITMGGLPFVHACCLSGQNTFVGSSAGNFATSASANTGIGSGALVSITSGNNNTALGYQALYSNTTGSPNTALGFEALFTNTSGTDNTASGFEALFNNTTGSNNTAEGFQALFGNTTGTENTASGQFALLTNTTGTDNSALGYGALLNSTVGFDNTASGSKALVLNTTGDDNTALGFNALGSNTTGSFNIAIGLEAADNVSGGNSNNIEIGNSGLSGDSGTIRIGASPQTSFFAAGISGVNIGTGAEVFVSSSGQLGTIASSQRFKEDIRSMGDASKGLMKLRPVAFRYKQPLEDGSKPIQYGLVAEEVAKIYPDMVVRGPDGQIQTVKYQWLAPMLLNEVQKQQHEIRKQQALVLAQETQLRSQKTLVEQQEHLLKAQAEQIKELMSQVRAVQASLRDLVRTDHKEVTSTQTGASLDSATRGGN